MMFAIVTCVLASLLSANVAYAGTATTAVVWTTDTAGNPKVEFNVGETVRIHWMADGTVDISVDKIAGGVEFGFPLTDMPNTGTYDFTPSKGSGIYEIKVTGSNVVMISYGTFFVVPELPMGAILATVASFAAFAVVIAKKRSVATVQSHF
jgi:hypothetical protein